MFNSTSVRMSNLELARAALQGEIDFYTEVARIASLAVAFVPKHKIITTRIETAIMAGLEKHVDWKTWPETGHRYPIQSVSVRKGYYSDKYEVTISAPQITADRRNREPNRTTGRASRYVGSVDDITTQLLDMAATYASNAADSAIELGQLHEVEADHLAVQAAKEAFNAKYGYTTRRFFEVGR